MKTYFPFALLLIMIFFHFSCAQQKPSKKGYESLGIGPIDTITFQTSGSTPFGFDIFHYDFPLILLHTKERTSNGLLNDQLSVIDLSTNETFLIEKQDFPQDTEYSIIRSIFPKKNGYYILFSQNQLYELSPSLPEPFNFITKLDLPEGYTLFERAMLSFKNEKFYAVIKQDNSQEKSIFSKNVLKLATFSREGSFLDSFSFFPYDSLNEINFVYLYDLFRYYHTPEGLAMVNVFQGSIFVFDEMGKFEKEIDIPFFPLAKSNELPSEPFSLESFNAGNQTLQDYMPKISFGNFFLMNDVAMVLVKKNKNNNTFYAYDIQKQDIVVEKSYSGQLLALNPKRTSGLFIKKTSGNEYVIYNEGL